uniref:Rho-GAP domain-containing protein n=1 Tax=Schistosoma mansoni TaxID=6183 RepID=A0A3Q0KU08_SCHMA
MDNNNNQITNTLQLTIKDYAYRLRIGIKEDWKIKLFREYYPRRFHELCMIHLSFLIDIPWNFIDQKIHYHSNNNDHTLHSSNTITTNVCNTMKDNKSTLMNTTNIGGTTTKSRLKRLWNNWRINSHPVKSDYIPDELANNIITLIDCLDNDEACSVEGLFRKPGHNLRKRQIQEAVFETSFDPKVFQLNKYNFHDFASALKSVLVRLPTPLFTEHLLPLFLQVAALRKFEQFHNHNNDHQVTMATNLLKQQQQQQINSPAINEIYLINLIESKQIKALRLLIQLLPNTNMKILKNLIQLLIRVKNLNHINRMTSTCLGTIFGPVLLPQNILLYDTIKNIKNHKQPPIECQEKCLQLNSITSLLIEIGLDIFLLPYSLVQDICTNSPYMTIFKTDSHSLRTTTTSTTTKQQSVDIKTNRLTLLLSPQFRHRNHLQTLNKEDAKNIDDSPPLRTAIRFATPTPTSIANFQVLDSSPIQFDDIMEISRTLKTKQQLKLENCIDQTPVLKWSRSVGEISSDYIQCSVEKSQHNDENLNITSVRSSNLSKISTNMNHLSPSKYPNYTNEQLEDICVDSVRRKFVKRRRFTELRLPSTINRTGGGGGKSCHRRYLFSPCPPIPLLPFKRVGGEERNFHISPLSTIKGTLTTNTALPSW